MDILGFLWIPNWLLCIIILIVTYIWYMSKDHGKWKSMGIKGPKPLPVFGNMKVLKDMGIVEAQRHWYKEYGRLYGTYLGKDPYLSVGDPDMLREILVKEFNNFGMRVVFEGFTKRPADSMLTVVKFDQWKHIRNSITPTFSSGKIKQMIPLINMAADRFVANLSRKVETGEDIEIKDASGQFSMDVIASVAFGIQVDSQQNPKEPFVVNAKALMDFNSVVLVILLIFPFIGKLMSLTGITLMKSAPVDFFVNFIDKAIEQRKDEQTTHKDFLQILLEEGEHNEASQQTKPNQTDSNDPSHQTYTGLTKDEIRAQAILFFLAGYETTGSTLFMNFYMMAVHQDVLDKVLDELDSVVGEDDVLTNELAVKLVYLEQFMLETQRLYPAAFRIDRVCTNSTTINGIWIEKGTNISVPIASIHHDPEFYPNPKKFDPDRFAPELRASRNPFHHLPFGYGPRSCIAMRLAQLEMKLCLAATLRTFRPVKVERTQDIPALSKLGRMEINGGAWIGMERRKTQVK